MPYTRYMPYMAQFASESEIRARDAEVRRFFRSDDPEEALRIARRLGAGHAYLYGAQSIDPAVESRLEKLYVEGGARLYRIPSRP